MFAWTHEDMPGIDPLVAIHKLSLNLTSRPIKQKKRNFSPECNQAIAEEIEKLLVAGFIKKVYYPDWLSNMKMVRKPNEKWRMCIDFIDLSKACPKDSFPLLRIDTLVDSTTGHQTLSFMDAFSRYNQIKMYGPDQEKTAFITDWGLYCY